MKKLLLLAGSAGVLSFLPLQADAENNSLSFNVSATSDYRYRGISQSRLRPALQGGVDYALPSGFYVGAWGSTIRWIRDAGRVAGVDSGGTNVEIDLYGGYKAEISKGLGYDVGVLQYWYPGNDYSRIAGAHNADTTELYGAVTLGQATLKYSHALTPLFGFGNSKNSGYLDLSATFDLGGGFSLLPHVGHQRVAHNSAFTYTDFSLGVSKDVAGFALSLTAVGTDTKNVSGQPHAYFSPQGRDLGRTALVVAAKRSF